jgi:hypothetical protein
MATTTPNNGWAVPTSTDYVADGAVAIETLGDAIDTSVGTGLLNWVSFTPTFANFTLGNGTVNFASCKIGKTVHVRYFITLGTTSVMGTGPGFNLPFANSGMPTTNYSSNLLDSGSAFYLGIATIAGNQAFFNTYRTDLLYAQQLGVNSTTPFTWAVNDFISGTFTYQAV